MMQADALTTDTRSAPKRRRKRPIDRRTRLGRRVVELQAKLAAELGGERGLTTSQRLAITRAAQLTAIAEALQQRQLAGEPVDIDQVVRMSNASARAVAALNLKPGAPAAPPGAPLDSGL